MQKTLELGLWAGNGGTTTQIEGIGRLIPATASGSQTTSIGGLSPSTNSWWRTLAYNMTGLPATQYLERALMEQQRQIEDNGGTVDIHFTSLDLANIYEDNQMNFLTSGNTKVGDFNFDTIKYKGNPISYSSLAPSGEWRLVDKNGLVFCVDPMFNFAWTDQKEQTGVPFTKHRQIVLDCALSRQEARILSCIYNISEE